MSFYFRENNKLFQRKFFREIENYFLRENLPEKSRTTFSEKIYQRNRELLSQRKLLREIENYFLREICSEKIVEHRLLSFRRISSQNANFTGQDLLSREISSKTVIPIRLSARQRWNLAKLHAIGRSRWDRFPDLPRRIRKSDMVIVYPTCRSNRFECWMRVTFGISVGYPSTYVNDRPESWWRSNSYCTE